MLPDPVYVSGRPDLLKAVVSRNLVRASIEVLLIAEEREPSNVDLLQALDKRFTYGKPVGRPEPCFQFQPSDNHPHKLLLYYASEADKPHRMEFLHQELGSSAAFDVTAERWAQKMADFLRSGEWRRAALKRYHSKLP